MPVDASLCTVSKCALFLCVCVLLFCDRGMAAFVGLSCHVCSNTLFPCHMQLGGLGSAYTGDDQATGCFQHIYVKQETIVDKSAPDKPHKNPCWNSFFP